MAFLGNWFVKITGWIPQLLIFRTKVYYEDKKVQSRRIKGKAIVVSNHNSLMDFAVLLFVFWRRTLRCLVDGKDKDLLTARTEGGRLVRFEGDAALIGTYQYLTITGSTTWSLTGQLTV